MPQLHPPFVDLAVEVMTAELTRLGHGPVIDRGREWGGYLDVSDAPSFTLAVNPTSDGQQVKIEWQSGLERSGHEVVGRVGIMDLAAIAAEIHEAIDRHRVAFGLVMKQEEDAGRDVILGKSRLQSEFRLQRNRRVEVDGEVNRQIPYRARFQVTVSDLDEQEAREILEALKTIGLIDPEGEEASDA